MARSSDSIDLRLISKISSMYYNRGLNQQEIANRLQLSRPKVSRLLKQAREQGVVQITIVTPNGNFVDLEQALEEKFDLKEVILVESEADMSPDLIKKQIGSAAANYLDRTVSNGHVIGVTWGTTLQAMVDSMQPKPFDDVHVVQALGGVGPPEAKAHATDISRRLSQLLNAKLTLLPAPGIIGSVEAKEILLNDPQVRNALNLFPKINSLFVGIGSIKTNPVLNTTNAEMSDSISQEIFESGAVGDISLHFFDPQGNEVDTVLKDLIIGVSLEQMGNIDNVVGIAGGPNKIKVIHAALSGKKINVLISDSITAQKLLDLD